MHWIGVGFLLAIGAWLFTIVLRWVQTHRSATINAALILASLAAVGIIIVAFMFRFWAGLAALAFFSNALQSLMKSGADTSTPAP